MRVLMISWEFPPTVVGGLGRHVEALAGELAAGGHEVTVVTRGEKPETVDELVGGIRVRRAAADPLQIDFTTESLLAWSQAQEHSLLRAALPLLTERPADVIHGHDWLVAQSAVTLAEITGKPLVVTVHATEAGRHQGWLPNPLNQAIHSVEGWLAGRAGAVIVCSSSMRAEVMRLFALEASRVHVVPNGIDAERWPNRWKPTGRATICYVGRLVHEKGVQTALAALPPLRQAHPSARLVVAGTGPYLAELQALAVRLGVADSVDWLGFVPDDELAALLARVDVAVVPSLYEPFGLVALEAAATGTPVVVAEAGGLADLAAAGIATASFPAGDPARLAASLDDVLGNPATTRDVAARACARVRSEFTWRAVAEHTAEIYERVSG